MMRLIAMHIWFLDELGWTTGHQPATLTPEERHDGRIPSSHVVMLLHPFEVAPVIRKAAAVRGRAALKGITNETHAGCDL
jgi:hypothetical protein